MPGHEKVRYERLAEHLQALGYGSRLELLHVLHVPHALSEVRLQPRQVGPGENPHRSIARQTLQRHLAKLIEIGVVIEWQRGEAGPRGKHYVVNPQALYEVMEEFRKVATVRPSVPVSFDATRDLGETQHGALEPGPKLVLVHGLYEGKVFPLRASDLRGRRGWVLGRKPGLHVSLDYDPYVSLENSEVVAEGDGYRLLDLKSSRNGTRLNWRRLGPDEAAPLRSGDVIGVGRSLLVFRGD